MPLAPGTCLGPYEVVSLIGAGGMGEVYKARDTRLDRTVAIKVLPPELASDAERRARFSREAKTISALNHPHICTLHDVGEATFPSPESRVPSPVSVSYLVMEHLQGETLADRLRRGALPLAQTLDLAAQVADALAAAHKQGVIHRDLKPGNIMLVGRGGPSGPPTVKLLDFGLAKLKGHGEQPAAGMLVSAPTQSGPLTGQGAIIGTLQYMAPEQLEGKEADARTDLFAFGTVVYEMVTGRRAFEGNSAASLIGAILEREPAPLAERQPLTPPALERLVRKCLAKSPDDRWYSAHDLADELRWISQTGPAPALASPVRRRARWRTVGLAAALVVLSGLTGAALLWRLRPAASPAPVVRPLLDVSPAENAGGGGSTTSTPGGSRTALAWTPDGRALVFVGRKGGVQQLHVRELVRNEARPLAGTDGVQVPVVSPDGAWVAFWSGGAIRRVAVAGGPTVVVCQGPVLPPVGMSWSSARQLVYANLADGALWQVSSEGGSATALTKRLPDERQHVLPQILPGGDVVLDTVRKYEWVWSQEEVVAQTLKTGARKVLLHDAVDARYVPSGHLVFLRQGTLLAVPFDLRRLEVRGSAVPLFEGVAQALTAGNTNDVTGAGQFSVAPTGALAYVAGPVVPKPDRALVAVDRHGTLTPLAAPVRSYGLFVRASADGRHLAVTVATTVESGLWLYDVTRGTLTKLTPPGGELELAVWAPDAQRVAFAWNRAGTPLLYWQRADGSSPRNCSRRSRSYRQGGHGMAANCSS